MFLHEIYIFGIYCFSITIFDLLCRCRASISVYIENMSEYNRLDCLAKPNNNRFVKLILYIYYI